MKRRQKITPPGLVGSFFHSNKPGTTVLEWQGRVLEKTGTDVFLVETYEWVMGEPHDRRLVRLVDMIGWTFYETADDMRRGYEAYCDRRDHKREAPNGADAAARA